MGPHGGRAPLGMGPQRQPCSGAGRLRFRPGCADADAFAARLSLPLLASACCCCLCFHLARRNACGSCMRLSTSAWTQCWNRGFELLRRAALQRASLMSIMVSLMSNASLQSPAEVSRMDQALP